MKIRDEADRVAFPDKANILEWIEVTGRTHDRDAIVISTIFPAALSDMLHCIYDDLENSRKGKLAITFILLRKPLQESTHLFETIIATSRDFVAQLKSDPTKLHSQKSGGTEAHSKRISQVLKVLPSFSRYNPFYLSQLRYDKNAEDSFDGVCNKAVHLFTTHQSIRTEPFNLNFIFSDMDARHSQWSFLYSRLPYILSYIHDIVEILCNSIAPTEPDYLKYIYRRKASLISLWSETVEPRYQEPCLNSFTIDAKQWLDEHCRQTGRSAANEQEIAEMAFEAR